MVEEAGKDRTTGEGHAESGFEIRNFLSKDATIAAQVDDESPEAVKNICD